MTQSTTAKFTRRKATARARVFPAKRRVQSLLGACSFVPSRRLRLAISRRRATVSRAERRVQMARVGEPPIGGDRLDRVVRLEQASRRPLQTMTERELGERDAHDLLEEPAERLSAESARARRLARGQEAAALEHELDGLVD